LVQDVWYWSLTMAPTTKTSVTIIAATAAIIRPYSTPDAPRSPTVSDWARQPFTTS
jgi:hypothetical protein